MSLMSRILEKPPPPKTRNEKFLEFLAEMRKKPHINGARDKKLQVSWELTKEFLDWMNGIQKKLELKNADFAKKLNISLRMLLYYKAAGGHFPSERVFRRLLRLEKLTRIKVTIIKNKHRMVKSKPIVTALVE